MQLICVIFMWVDAVCGHSIKRPLNLDYEFPVTGPVTVFQLIMRQLFHYSLFDYILFLYIMLGLRQSQIMESYSLIIFLDVLKQNEKEHILFLSKIKEI